MILYKIVLLILYFYLEQRDNLNLLWGVVGVFTRVHYICKKYWSFAESYAVEHAFLAYSPGFNVTDTTRLIASFIWTHVRRRLLLERNSYARCL